MMTRMRAFTSRSAVTFEDTRAGMAVYGHDPEALVVAGEVRAAKESARPRYVVAALARRWFSCSSPSLFPASSLPSSTAGSLPDGLSFDPRDGWGSGVG